MNFETKLDLITRNLQEIIDEEMIEKIIKVRPLKIYWGTSPTGSIHIGYFIPILKIIDFLNAGCEVTILIADLHAYLDNQKSTEKNLKKRTEYYTLMIGSMLQSLGADSSKIKFINGTDFQLTEKYTMDVYRLNSLIGLKDARCAGAEVVKISNNPTMTSLLYSSLQALDEEYLGVDAEFSGIDQVKIFANSRKYLHRLGYKKRSYLMSPMLPGLRFSKQIPIKKEDNLNKLKNSLIDLISKSGSLPELQNSLSKVLNEEEEDVINNKMSASNPDSKIDLLDSKKKINQKIKKAYCLPGEIEDNSPLTLLKMVLFPILNIRGDKFFINRKEKFGGPIIYENYIDVENDFKNEILHPGDLKLGLVDLINSILNPIRKAFSTKEKQKILREAY